jgi:predicted house-cleaning noncanonical NTP pyrophosphatase (MazG superfamily)
VVRIEYHKLVRDKIPEHIRNDGYTCDTTTMNELEYQDALRAKLIEEALEAASANEEKLMPELADLYEVIDALMACYGIDAQSVRTEQQRKYEERGGFEQRIRLIGIER